MMRGIGIVPLALLAGISTAHAGPWAREQGDVFLSFSLSSATDRDAIGAGTFDADHYLSLYGEVGVGRRYTLGFDLGGDENGDLYVVFLRRTFSQDNATWQFAADIGFGQRSSTFGGDSELYRLGFSVGRGFGPGATDWLPFFQPSGGWFSLDSSFAYLSESGDSIVQAEATLGLNLTEQFAGLVQLKVEEWPDADTSVTLSPSVLYRFNGGPTALQVGTRFGLSGSDEVGLRLGLWREF